MRRKSAALLVAAAVALQPLTSYAAASPSAGPTVTTSSDNRDRDISKDYQMTDFKSKTDNGSSAGDSTPGVSVVSGGAVGTEGKDTAQAAPVSLIFGAGNDPVSSGLANDVVEKINTINSGTEPLYRTIGTSDLVGYSALIPVSTVAVIDVAAKDPQTGKVSMTIYVPNLLEGLNDVQILYYNATTHQWEKAAPAAIDFAAKQITLSIDDRTPFTVIYKSKK